MADDIEFFAYEKIGGQVTAEDVAELEALSAKMKSDDDARVYLGSHAAEYRGVPTHGYAVLEVLTHLYGLPFTNLIMAHVHALRPSAVRVTSDEVTLDAHTWRVTVFLADDGTVRRIEQEVEVAYGSGYDIGQCLEEARTGRKPVVPSGCYFNANGLERIDFT